MFGRIDLHERGSGRNMLSGVNINLSNLPLDLGHDDGRIARFQRSDVIGGVVKSGGMRNLKFDRDAGRPLGWLALGGTVSAGGAEDSQSQCRGQDNRGDQRTRRCPTHTPIKNL